MTAVVLDLGNTRWKLAVARDGRLGHVASGEHRDAPAAWRSIDTTGATRLLIGSVGDPQVAMPLVADLQRVLDVPARWVASTDALPGVQSGYRKPEQLGVDRLLAIVAARAVSRAPLCVIDAGTAVTIDFVDDGGRHLGGFILPGMVLSRECLLANTAIPRDSVVHADDTLGRDTPTAVALGARHAVAGLVERFLAGSRALFDARDADLVIGGGDADLLAPLLHVPCIKMQHLVLRGLAVIDSQGDH